MSEEKKRKSKDVTSASGVESGAKVPPQKRQKGFEKRKRVLGAGAAKSGTKEHRNTKHPKQAWKGSDKHDNWKGKKENSSGMHAEKAAQAPGFEETVCLCCRKRGHTMAHCPHNPNKPVRKKDLTCFRCGEAGHGIKTCPLPKEQGLTFAVCFICQVKGHISRDCPQNTRGIYPKGGSCKICGDVWHLAKDCPEKGTAKDKKASADTSAVRVVDEDLAGNAAYDEPKPRSDAGVESGAVNKKKKVKTIKF